ncbi:MAG TPA: T9SS type A sorting domain-containing protein, partial [Saprospiraceae bacterium]|nr:T9SS type A sorting domain-containing protein [Saprospiraceae bacterium]
GGERHYFLNGIIADSLGGCCVYGFVREPGITDGKEGQAIPFIMCFNDQGELTSYTTPQLPEERLFSIKGNPAYNSIILGNIYGQSGYTYSIFDTNGHKVSAGVLNTDDAVLDVSKLSAGMYLLSIQNKDAKVVQVEKLVKQ